MCKCWQLWPTTDCGSFTRAREQYLFGYGRHPPLRTPNRQQPPSFCGDGRPRLWAPNSWRLRPRGRLRFSLGSVLAPTFFPHAAPPGIFVRGPRVPPCSAGDTPRFFPLRAARPLARFPRRYTRRNTEPCAPVTAVRFIRYTGLCLPPVRRHPEQLRYNPQSTPLRASGTPPITPCTLLIRAQATRANTTLGNRGRVHHTIGTSPPGCYRTTTHQGVENKLGGPH